MKGLSLTDLINHKCHMSLKQELKKHQFKDVAVKVWGTSAIPPLIKISDAEKVVKKHMIAVMMQYTGQDVKSVEALIKRMEDYMHTPTHKPVGEDPGY